jgi:DTW domain-containing protein YfiP
MNDDDRDTIADIPARAPAGPPPEAAACPRCGKPGSLCVCDAVDPVRTAWRLLVLQHPQEQDVALGTASILAAQVEGTVLRVGLSWPNLGAALGAAGGRAADPKRWGVLHLGPARTPQAVPPDGLVALDRHGAPLPDQAAERVGLDGLVLLDGSWSQAKALWWRNPWLLKCRRFVVVPGRRSRYGTLRREPRAESVATIEAAALALAALAGDPALEARIVRPFEALVARAKGRAGPPRAPDRRRRGPGRG